MFKIILVETNSGPMHLTCSNRLLCPLESPVPNWTNLGIWSHPIHSLYLALNLPQIRNWLPIQPFIERRCQFCLHSLKICAYQTPHGCRDAAVLTLCLPLYEWPPRSNFGCTTTTYTYPLDPPTGFLRTSRFAKSSKLCY